MRFWFQLSVSCWLLTASGVFSLSLFAAQGNVLPQTGAEPRGRLFCTNDSGELRCSREAPLKPVAPRAATPSQHSAPVADPLATGTSVPPIVFPREIFVEVNVNERSVDDFARVLQVSADGFYADADQFARWRIKLPAVKPSLHDGAEYFPLRSQGISCRLEPVQQVLFLRVPALAFMESTLNLRARQTGSITESVTGMFLNHDIQSSYTSGQWSVGGLMEMGFFSKFGVLTNRVVARDLTRAVLPYRLDTQFVRDFPGRMATLTIGDTISAPSPWSRQVHYGGVRWASKFSTQPNFIPFALPGLSGLAGQPSTVDIYVDNVRTAQQHIDAGPFSIRNVPVLNGQGELRMVVTDVLGRQQVVALSYIASAQLLRKGVTEYAYESGSLRRGFGSLDSGYHSFFVSGAQRWGLSDLFTLNLRGEVLADQQAFGLGADFGLSSLGVLGGGAVVSHASGGAGYLLYGQAQHKARWLSASVSLQAASRRFRQLGMFSGENPFRLLGQVQVSRALGSHSSISAGYVHREQYKDLVPSGKNPGNVDFKGYTASVGLRVAGNVFLNITTNYSPGSGNRPTAAINFIVPLGERKLLSATSTIDKNGFSSMAEVSRQLPAGNGYGYRVRNSLNNAERTDAGVYLQNNLGRFGFEASRNGREINWRLSEAGSLVMIKGHVMFSRRIDDSFAVVEVPGGKGVRVFANNQFITRTNRRGLALVPRLVPYDRNSVYLDDEGLPLELGVDFQERTVTPRPRSGVLLRFTASRIQGALLELTTKDGKPVPLGATVSVNGSSEMFLVALRGEVFVSTFSFPAKLIVKWDTGSCEAFVQSPPGDDPLPRIGSVVCKPQ